MLTITNHVLFANYDVCVLWESWFLAQCHIVLTRTLPQLSNSIQRYLVLKPGFLPATINNNYTCTLILYSSCVFLKCML